MPPPSWNPPEDEPGVIRIKTIGVLQPPSFSEDQAQILSVSVSAERFSDTFLFSYFLAKFNPNVYIR
jgi:hypothetical protein